MPEYKLPDNVITTKLDKFIGWARSYSLWQYVFGTACCAMEFMSVSASHYDTDRFGAAMPRYSPRQADTSGLPQFLLICGGAMLCQRAILTIRFSSLANVSAVVNQQMAESRPVGFGDYFGQIEFQLYRIPVF